MFLDESKFWNWTRIFVILKQKKFRGKMVRLQRKLVCLRLWASLFNFEIAMLQICWGFCRKPGNDRPDQGVTLSILLLESHSMNVTQVVKFASYPKLGSYTSFRKTLIVIVQIIIVGQGSKSPHIYVQHLICSTFSCFISFEQKLFTLKTFIAKSNEHLSRRKNERENMSKSCFKGNICRN